MKYRVKRHAVTQPLDQSYRLIPLTQGQNAIVDVADFSWVSQWNWHAWFNPSTRSFYAIRNGKWPKRGNRQMIWMHREILLCVPKQEGDHKNHDTLDNRKKNLRRCTHLQNGKNKRKPLNNSSGFKGVSWHKGSEKWAARIFHNGKLRHIGEYRSIVEAAKAYDRRAKELYGQFAHVNFHSHLP